MIDPRVSLPEHSSVTFVTTISVSYFTQKFERSNNKLSASFHQFCQHVVNSKLSSVNINFINLINVQ